MNNVDSAAAENMKRFIEHLLRYTVRLVRLAEGDNAPEGLCSGILIRKNRDVFVLSAFHSLKKGRYTLETNVVLEGTGQTVAIPLNSVFHTARVRFGPELEIESEEEIDFGWCKLDLDRVQKDFRSNRELTFSTTHRLPTCCQQLSKR